MLKIINKKNRALSFPKAGPILTKCFILSFAVYIIFYSEWVSSLFIFVLITLFWFILFGLNFDRVELSPLCEACSDTPAEAF